ncbi:MAG: hypothetical protein PHS41_09240 [Victivallaceae bacterium]|nr:hypothetical protein [Victivallaceae bacterium]
MAEQTPNARTGCGGVAGCLILAIAATAVLVYFVVRPFLEERGWTLERISRSARETAGKVEELGDKAKAGAKRAAEQVRGKAEKVEDKAEDAVEAVEDHVEAVKEKVEEAPLKPPKAVKKVEEKADSLIIDR